MVEARAAGPYTYEPDFASRQAVLWSVFWLVAAVTVGLLVQARLLFPDLLADLSFLSYGRLRAVFESLLWWGWLGTAAVAALFVILPRIGEVQLHNEPLGAATVIFWSFVLFVGAGTMLAGMNQGRPLGELPGGADAILFVLMALVLYNAGTTIARRRERTLYASGWYLLASAVLLPVIYAVGNLPAFEGVADATVSGFYRNGIEFLWLLPTGLAIAYYIVPIETGNALHSPRLARIGFWALFFAGGWTGARFAIGGPLPDWQESIAVAMTAVVAIPVLSAVSNLFSTGRGRWSLLAQAYGLRWAATGLALSVVWIGLVFVSSVPQVAAFVGLTTWSDGVTHLAVFGVFSAFAFALVYRAYPLLVGRAWFSERLSSFHFWATLVGTGAGTALLLAGGVAQAVAQQTWGRVGDPGAFGELAQWIALSQRSFQFLAAAAFAVVVVAQYAFAYNAMRTASRGPIVQLSYGSVPAGRAA